MKSTSKKTGARKARAPRNSQLQRIEAGFNSSSMPAYAGAWAEFKALLYGLLADEDFWQLAYVRPLLPHLVSARQEIDRTNREDRRSKAGAKGAATGKVRATGK